MQKPKKLKCFILTVLKLLPALETIVRQIKLDFLSKYNTKGLELNTNLKVSPNIKLCAFSDNILSQLRKIYLKFNIKASKE